MDFSAFHGLLRCLVGNPLFAFPSERSQPPFERHHNITKGEFNFKVQHTSDFKDTQRFSFFQRRLESKAAQESIHSTREGAGGAGRPEKDIVHCSSAQKERALGSTMRALLRPNPI